MDIPPAARNLITRRINTTELPKVIDQLEELIADRESFIYSDGEACGIYIADKEALEEAVKVLTVILDKRQVTFTADPEWVYYDAPDPGGNSGQCGILMGLEEDRQHIKIQYKGEELTIKELTDRLRYVLLDRDDWKELAESRYERMCELKRQLSDAQTVRHGRWKLVGADSRGRGGTWICTACNTCQPYVSDYCPHCGAKMDGGKEDG